MYHRTTETIDDACLPAKKKKATEIAARASPVTHPPQQFLEQLGNVITNVKKKNPKYFMHKTSPTVSNTFIQSQTSLCV